MHEQLHPGLIPCRSCAHAGFFACANGGVCRAGPAPANRLDMCTFTPHIGSMSTLSPMRIPLVKELPTGKPACTETTQSKLRMVNCNGVTKVGIVTVSLVSRLVGFDAERGFSCPHRKAVHAGQQPAIAQYFHVALYERFPMLRRFSRIDPCRQYNRGALDGWLTC